MIGAALDEEAESAAPKKAAAEDELLEDCDEVEEDELGNCAN